MMFSDTSKTSCYNSITADYEADATGAKYFRFRNGLSNTYYKITNDKKLNVVFIGGSITFVITRSADAGTETVDG